MRLYLDTEFNGHGGDLLSMALVPANPIVPPWYEVKPWVHLKLDPWVQTNVVPKFGKAPIDGFKSAFQHYIRQFLDPEIVCDWNADAVHLCRQLEGPTYDTSLDFGCTIRILNVPLGAYTSKDPHNALADATALMEWCEAKRRAA